MTTRNANLHPLFDDILNKFSPAVEPMPEPDPRLDDMFEELHDPSYRRHRNMEAAREMDEKFPKEER